MTSISGSLTLQAIHRDLQAIAEKAAQIATPLQPDEMPPADTPSFADTLVGIKVDELSVRANIKVLQYVNAIEDSLLDIIA